MYKIPATRRFVDPSAREVGCSACEEEEAADARPAEWSACKSLSCAGAADCPCAFRFGRFAAAVMRGGGVRPLRGRIARSPMHSREQTQNLALNGTMVLAQRRLSTVW